MKKICVVITARPSYSRIRSALLELKKNSSVILQIIIAASAATTQYGNVKKQIKEDGFDVIAEVYNLISGENTLAQAKTTGLGIIELSSVFESIEPDIVVTIADRYETISTAIAATYMNIPLAHIQGGEVTGNIDEKVRHAITKLADIHLVSTEKARERVIKMGEAPDSVYVTGCPSIDVAFFVKKNIKNYSFDPIEKYGGVGEIMDDRKDYVVVMFHPVTTEIEDSSIHTKNLLAAVDQFGCQIYWFWPNVDAGADVVSKEIRTYREEKKNKHIRFFKHMSPEDTIALLYKSKCVIGNSSVGIRECSYLGVPAINIGNRQAGRERGKNVIDVGYEVDDIIQGYHAVETGKYNKSDKLYGDGNAGKNIAAILESLQKVKIDKRLQY